MHLLYTTKKTGSHGRKNKFNAENMVSLYNLIAVVIC